MASCQPGSKEIYSDVMVEQDTHTTTAVHPKERPVRRPPAPSYSSSDDKMYTEADWSREHTMPINIRGVMQLLCLVNEKQKRKVAFKLSGLGALVVGTMAFFGGSIAGPPGFAVGGAIGGLLGAWMISGQSKLTPQIILGQRPVVQKRLYKNVCAIIQNLGCTNIAQFKALVMANGALQEKLFGVLTSYITSKLRRRIEYGN